MKPHGHDGIPPDRFELTIRFVAGFAVGGLAGAMNTIWFFDIESTGVLITTIAVTAVLGGLLAMFFGDRFWGWLRWLF